MKEYKTGDYCHECKTGKIALATQLVNKFDLDQEPYEDGKVEGHNVSGLDGAEILANECILLSVHICDECGQLYSGHIDNMDERFMTQSKGSIREVKKDV